MDSRAPPVSGDDAKIEAVAAVTTTPTATTKTNDASFSAVSLPDSSSQAASADRDDSYDIYKQYQHAEFSPEEVKRVLRKIDLRLLPVLIVTYTLQYLDKNAINFASVYGLQKGTHLTGQDYSWLGVSYIHRQEKESRGHKC